MSSKPLPNPFIHLHMLVSQGGYTVRWRGVGPEFHLSSPQLIPFAGLPGSGSSPTTPQGFDASWSLGKRTQGTKTSTSTVG